MKKIFNLFYLPKLFWIILILKIISSFLFASEFVTHGFLPFIEFFLQNGGNPYDKFIENIVFPYPSGMLYLFSIPLFIGKILFNSIFQNINLSLFLFRLPILISDIGIYFILCKIIPTKQKRVLLLYFASPVLFYINYYHGQLDVIPTFFLFLTLYFIYFKNYITSFLFLGFGLAMKTNLLVAIPFISLFLFKQKIGVIKILLLNLLSFTIFGLINIPLLSNGFINSVFNNSEQQRLFFFAFNYQFNNYSLLIAPGAILLIFYIFYSYKKVNFDSLILILGLAFTVLIALVPPMQGWFYWSIPLIVFFLIKYKNSRLGSFWLMNIFIILFYFFIKDSDIFQSLTPTFKVFNNFITPYLALEMIGLNPTLVQNILFTLMQVLVIVNAYWCYRISNYYNHFYVEKEVPFIFGIGGDSSVGKSTLSLSLEKIIGNENMVTLNGDDAHKWERKDKNWKLYSHLNPVSNKVHKDVEQLVSLASGQSVERVSYSHKTGKFNKPQVIDNNHFILLQGLHPFLIKSQRAIFDLKIYIEAEEKLRIKWKTKRDNLKRGQSVSFIKKEIKRRVKDAEKFIYPQKAFADWKIRYEFSKKEIKTIHTFVNSVPLDSLINELEKIPTLSLKYAYTDMEHHVLECFGVIKKSEVEKIAYRLYPNLNELLTLYPIFQSDLKGISQLLFINYLNYYYSQKLKSNERFY